MAQQLVEQPTAIAEAEATLQEAEKTIRAQMGVLKLSATYFAGDWGLPIINSARTKALKERATAVTNANTARDVADARFHETEAHEDKVEFERLEAKADSLSEEKKNYAKTLAETGVLKDNRAQLKTLRAVLPNIYAAIDLPIVPTTTRFDWLLDVIQGK